MLKPVERHAVEKSVRLKPDFKIPIVCAEAQHVINSPHGHLRNTVISARGGTNCKV